MNIDEEQKVREVAVRLLRNHWEKMGLNPDEMASLDRLGETERASWITRAETEVRAEIENRGTNS